MLFWLFVILFVLALTFAIVVWRGSKVYDKKRDATYKLDWKEAAKAREKLNKSFWGWCDDVWSLCEAVIGITILFGVTLLIASIILAINLGGAAGQKVRMEQTYESLTYQLENKEEIYGNDVIDTKELYNQVQKWNEDLAVGKTYEKHFWVGIYWPDIYSDLEFIEYK